MAINVLTEPTEFYPIFHDSIFNLDSTNKAQLNFKYVFRIIVAGQPERIVKVSPTPISGNGFFDVRTHLLDFLNQDIFVITDPNFQNAPRVEYIMKINEEYDDGAGNHITNVDEHIFATKIGFNTHLNRNDFFGDLTKLKIGDVTRELLINIKPLSVLYQDDILFIHFAGKPSVVGGVAVPAQLKVTELNRSAGILATTFISPDLDFFTQLVTMDLGAIVFNAATYFIDVQLIGSIDSPANILTKPYRFTIQPRPCTTYTPYKLIYLDAKGSYLPLNFDGVSTKELKTKSKKFRKFINPITETETSRGVQRFFQDTSERFKLNTFFTDENNNLMFEDLIKSDRVFVDLRNNSDFPNVDFFPVEILKNSITPIKTENGELPQYTFDMRFAFEQIDR